MVSSSFSSSTTTSSSAAATTSSPTCPVSNGTIYTTDNGDTFEILCYMDYTWNDLDSISVSSCVGCLEYCSTLSGCVSVTYGFASNVCYTHSKAVVANLNYGAWGAALVSITAFTASSSASASATAVPARGAMTNTQNKRGLAYNDAANLALFEGGDVQTTWCYNWGQISGGASSSFEYIPMLWGNSEGLTETWNATVYAAIESGTTHILGFNEPDFTDQSNISPADAAQAYMEWMQPFANLMDIGGPAITDAGLTWLSEFYGNCTQLGCTIDFQPVHWYDDWWNTGWFTSYLEQAYGIAEKPIWITEFQGWGDNAQQIDFLETVTPWLDAAPWIGGYAYFAVLDTILINATSSGNTTISNIGVTYNTYYNSTVASYLG